MIRTFLRFRDRYRRRASWAGLAFAISWVGATPPGARAQTQAQGANLTDQDEEQTERSFRLSFGLEADRRSLELGGEARGRALKRLSGLSQRMPVQVAELLDQWLTTEPKLSPADTWTLMRPLAALGAQPRIRDYLGRVFAGEALHVEASNPYSALVGEVAALALAKHQTPESMALLGDWLRRPSERAQVVRRALLAHPPKDVSALFDTSGRATPLLLETLGDLGNRDAVPYLRKVVKRATADVQAAATMALAKLGVAETRDLATLWLSRSDSPPELLMASAFVFLQFERAERATAFARLARVNAHMALTLAEHVRPDPSLLVLTEHLDDLATLEERQRAVRVLAALEGRSVAALAALLKARADLRWDVARALGDHAPSDAVITIAPLLNNAETRVAALSVLVAIYVRHPAVSRTTMLSELERSTRSSNAGERAIARTGLAVLDERRAQTFLESDDPSELFAAASAAGVHGRDYLKSCLRKLERLTHAAPSDTPSTSVLALGSVLSFASPTDVLSQRMLRRLDDSSLPIANTARWHNQARHYAEQEPESLAPSPAPTGPLVAAEPRRSHRHSPSHAYTLLNRLSLEADAELRAAVVDALRPYANLRTISETLDWLAKYDPSLLVRRVAAAEVSDESRLRPVWITAPDSTAPDAGYWVTIEAANRAPAAFYVAHGHNALLFIPNAVRTSDRAQQTEAASGDVRFLVPSVGTSEVFPYHVRTRLSPEPTRH